MVEIVVVVLVFVVIGLLAYIVNINSLYNQMERAYEEEEKRLRDEWEKLNQQLTETECALIKMEEMKMEEFQSTFQARRFEQLNHELALANARIAGFELMLTESNRCQIQGLSRENIEK